MLRIPSSLAVAIAALPMLCACEQSSTGDMAVPADPGTASASTGLSSKEAYDQVCASCHEEGVNGAPRTGDREAWSGRSWLWEAVLFEHVKQGYMDMPARGGDESLADVTAEKAAEYMLSKTYPDLKPSD
jgi:cytochrome c5